MRTWVVYNCFMSGREFDQNSTPVDASGVTSPIPSEQLLPRDIAGQDFASALGLAGLVQDPVRKIEAQLKISRELAQTGRPLSSHQEDL